MINKIFVFSVFAGSNHEMDQDLIEFTDDKLLGDLIQVDKDECELKEYQIYDASMQIYKASAELYNKTTNEIFRGNFTLFEHEMIKGMLLTKNKELIFVVLKKDYEKIKLCDLITIINENFD